MANTVQHKRSSTAGAQPTAGAIAVGELAINLADRKLYSKTAGGTVVPIGGGATGSGGDAVFYENDTTVNTSHTIAKNSHTVGPITVASGQTLTVNTGIRLVIL